MTPADQAELAGVVHEAFARNTPLYPLGGGTAVDFGVVPARPGLGVSLAGLNRVVDYPSRDMTITVEAGIGMAELTAILAREGQRLPIDAGGAAEATLGGVVATNFSGPRRYGQGTIRDYLIGVSAVDGRGVAFKAGGRVVKNVAGYDLGKLLVGSLGTLAIISQITLKVKPLPHDSAFLSAAPRDFDQTESLLAALVDSRTTPTAIELVAGPVWQAEPELADARDLPAGRLLVGLEGTVPEVDWMVEQLGREWRELGMPTFDVHLGEAAGGIWSRLTEFPAQGESPLVVKFNVRPSAITTIVKLLLDVDPHASLQAHAGNGIVIGRLSEFSLADASRVLIQRLQPAAVAAGGNVIVWSCRCGELTRQAIWGANRGDAELMRSVKRRFDPKGLLNPDRFVYGTLGDER
ncbi:MAG TPA: FAD-binding oxidoreductase [Pirellulales bacterium]|nr:FAD-binding oxidoreductase [Pirellulales bacterium]